MAVKLLYKNGESGVYICFSSLNNSTVGYELRLDVLDNRVNEYASHFDKISKIIYDSFSLGHVMKNPPPTLKNPVIEFEKHWSMATARFIFGLYRNFCLRDQRYPDDVNWQIFLDAYAINGNGIISFMMSSPFLIGGSTGHQILDSDKINLWLFSKKCAERTYAMLQEDRTPAIQYSGMENLLITINDNLMRQARKDPFNYSMAIQGVINAKIEFSEFMLSRAYSGFKYNQSQFSRTLL